MERHDGTDNRSLHRAFNNSLVSVSHNHDWVFELQQHPSSAKPSLGRICAQVAFIKPSQSCRCLICGEKQRSVRHIAARIVLDRQVECSCKGHHCPVRYLGLVVIIPVCVRAMYHHVRVRWMRWHLVHGCEVVFIERRIDSRVGVSHCRCRNPSPIQKRTRREFVLGQHRDVRDLGRLGRILRPCFAYGCGWGAHTIPSDLKGDDFHDRYLIPLILTCSLLAFGRIRSPRSANSVTC